MYSRLVGLAAGLHDKIISHGGRGSQSLRGNSSPVGLALRKLCYGQNVVLIKVYRPYLEAKISEWLDLIINTEYLSYINGITSSFASL